MMIAPECKLTNNHQLAANYTDQQDCALTEQEWFDVIDCRKDLINDFPIPRVI